MSLFVAGTDSAVGKTAVSALLLARYADELDLAYWKPIATGAELGRDSVTVAGLVPATVEIRMEFHLLRDSAAPLLAARREGVVIDIDEIAAAWTRWQEVSPERGVVVEGVGGIMEALNERQQPERLIDLIALLELPVLLVAPSAPESIDPTLSSLRALRRRGIVIAGVVLNGPPEAGNRPAIEGIGNVPVIAEIAFFEASAESVAAAATAFDVPGELREFLTKA